jgi:sec-independent protein translocase protein TatA
VRVGVTGPHPGDADGGTQKVTTKQANNNKIGTIDMLGLDNPIHILFLLLLVLVVFGAKRLPEMGQSLGTGMRGFKDALTGESGHNAGAQPGLTQAAQNGAVVADKAANATRAPESRA